MNMNYWSVRNTIYNAYILSFHSALAIAFSRSAPPVSTGNSPLFSNSLFHFQLGFLYLIHCFDFHTNFADNSAFFFWIWNPLPLYVIRISFDLCSFYVGSICGLNLPCSDLCSFFLIYLNCVWIVDFEIMYFYASEDDDLFDLIWFCSRLYCEMWMVIMGYLD